jgi:hypothetical protein
MGRRDRLTPQERYIEHRINFLPGQLARARLKVLHLEREAERLGLTHLLKDKN